MIAAFAPKDGPVKAPSGATTRTQPRIEAAQADDNFEAWAEGAAFDLKDVGLRVDEMKTLTWRNVLWTDGDILLEAAGKTKSTRRLILRAAGMRALRRLAQRRRRWLAANEQKIELARDERVIAFPDGTTVRDLKKSFSALLQACGFKYTTAKELVCPLKSDPP